MVCNVTRASCAVLVHMKEQALAVELGSEYLAAPAAVHLLDALESSFKPEMVDEVRATR